MRLAITAGCANTWIIRPGHAKNPLSDAQLEGKFHSLADRRLGQERASTVLETGWRLDALDDAGAILRLLAL